MFSHVVLGSNDVERSRRFYDALFAAIGGPPGALGERGVLVYQHGGSLLLVGPPRNGAPATVSNGATVGFAAGSPEAVLAWAEAGVAQGGTLVEDPPGVRETPFGPINLAYLRDPDGNKLAVAFRAT